jgi:WD40 repeat protein
LKLLEADSRILRPVRRYTHHARIVNDVQYHPISKNFIGSVSDDQTLQIVDLRQSETNKAAVVAKQGHLDAINALAFNPKSEVLVATASADKTIGIWDLRNVKEKVHTLEGHNDAVPPKPASWEVEVMTEELSSGTYLASGRNSFLMTRTTALLSCKLLPCLCSNIILISSLLFVSF